MKIKLIASDIDGTLLDSNHELPLETERTLLLMANHDVPFMLATGKTLYASRDLLKRLDFLNNTFGAFLNGALLVKRELNPKTDNDCERQIIPGYKIFHEQPLNQSSVLWFIERCLEWNVTIVVYSYDSIFTPQEETEKHLPFFQGLLKFHEPDITYHSTLLQDIKNKSLTVHKIIMMEDPRHAETLMKKFLQHKNIPTDIHLFPTQPEMLEVLDINISKSIAIQKVCEILNIEMENVMSFGDGTNDFEMIRDCGHGVAMGNAIQELKDIADAIALTNDESGVSAYIRVHFGL